MRRFTLLAIAATFVAACGIGRELSAQQTSTGAFGTRTTGGTSGLSSNRSSTSGGRTNMTSGTSSIGGGSGGSLLQDVTGESEVGARYTRNARSQGGQQFVGADTTDSRAVGVVQAGSSSGGNAGGGRGGQQQFGLLGGNNALSQLFQGGQFNQGNQRQRSSPGQLRIPIRIGFDAPPIATAKFTARFQTNLDKLPALTLRGPIQVLVENETVVLRGVVASEGDRQLVADLARLEPTVSEVRNELTVQAAGESDSGALPAPAAAIP